MVTEFEIKDSGERRGFDSGAKRDVDYDKPRFDLIPMTALRKIVRHFPKAKTVSFRDNGRDLSDETKAQMWGMGFAWGEKNNETLLLDIAWMSLQAIHKQEDDGFLTGGSFNDAYLELHCISPKTYLRIANHYGGGAKKYDSWNWSRGMPFSVFHASLMRHIYALVENKGDEDHLSAIFFNAAAILHFQIVGREDMDDITPRLVEWFPGGVIR